MVATSPHGLQQDEEAATSEWIEECEAGEQPFLLEVGYRRGDDNPEHGQCGDGGRGLAQARELREATGERNQHWCAAEDQLTLRPPVRAGTTAGRRGGGCRGAAAAARPPLVPAHGGPVGTRRSRRGEAASSKVVDDGVRP